MPIRTVFLKRAFVFCGAILLLCGMPVFAQTTKVAELQQKLKQNLPDTARLRLLGKLSAAYSSVDPEKKFIYAVKYKDLAEALGIDSTAAEAYMDMGVSYGIRSKLDSALYYFSIGYDRSKAAHYPRGIARSLACSGYVYDRLDNKQQAVSNYLEALRIFKKLNYTRGINQCLTNIGSIYYDLAQYKLAEGYFSEVLKSYTAVKDESGIAYAMFTLGNTAKKTGDLSKARNYYAKSLSIREKLGDLNGIALGRWGLGTIDVEEKHYDKALSNLEIALAHNRALKNAYQENAVMISIIDAYLGKKDFDNAEKYGLKALEISRNMDSKISISEVLERLIEVTKGRHNLEQAFQYQTQLIAMRDSIQAEKTVNDVTLMEFGRIRSENDSLIKNNERISTKNIGYRKTIFIVSGLLLVVMLLLFILYLRNREKHETNKLLQQQAAEIAGQNAELEKLDAVKNKFFSIVSHDLRSPLSTLRMLFGLYREGQIGEAELRELLSKLEETIYSTSAFLDNLLEWSKSQLDGILVRPSAFSPGHLVVENLRLIDSQVKLKQLKIQNNADPAIMAFADPNMADLVIRNLISNSVKFCRPGDSIIFEMTAGNGAVTLSIRDTGPGISEKDLGKLFSLEHTISTGSSGEKGHHLGLILCKDMMDQNNGSISVDSVPDAGAIFRITFPAAK